VLSSEDSIPDT